MPKYMVDGEEFDFANDDEYFDFVAPPEEGSAPVSTSQAAPALDVFARLRDLPADSDPKTRAALFDEVTAKYEQDKAKLREISSRHQAGRSTSPEELRRISAAASEEARAAGLEGVDVSSIKNYVRSRTGGKVRRGWMASLEKLGDAIATSAPGRLVGAAAAAIPGLKEDTQWEREYQAATKARQELATSIAGREKSPRVTAEHLKKADAEMGSPGADYSTFESWMRTTKAGSPKDVTKFGAGEQFKSDYAEELAAAAAPEVDASVGEIIGSLPKSIFSKRFLRGFTDPREVVATLATAAIGKAATGTARAVTGARRGATTARNVAANATRATEQINRLERTIQRASSKVSAADMQALREAQAKARALYNSGSFARASTAADAVEQTRRAARTGRQAAAEVGAEALKSAPHWAGESVGEAVISQALSGQSITPSNIAAELATGAIMTAPSAGFSSRARRRAQREMAEKMAAVDAPAAVGDTRSPEIQPLVEPAASPVAALPAPDVQQALPPGAQPAGLLEMREVSAASPRPDGVIEVQPSVEGLAQANTRTERLGDITAAVDEQRRIEQEPLARQMERNRIAQVTEPLATERDIRAREAEVGGPAAAAQRSATLDAMAPNLAAARGDIAARQDAGYVATSPSAPEPEVVPQIAAKIRKVREGAATGTLPEVQQNSIKAEISAKAAARKVQQDARRKTASIIANARQRAADGDIAGAKKMLEESKATFAAAHGENADLEMDTAIRKAEASANRRKKPEPIQRQPDVAQSNAKVDEGVAALRNAATRAEVDDIVNAYEAPVRDATPRRRSRFNNVAKAQADALTAAEARKALEPAQTPPVAQQAPLAGEQAPPPAPPERQITGIQRRKVSGGGASIVIPGIDEITHAPASSSIELIDGLVKPVEDGVALSDSFSKILDYAADDEWSASRAGYRIKEFLDRSLPPSRIDDIRVLADREKLLADGDLEAVAKFDDDNGLLEPGVEGGTRGEEMALRAPLNPAELAFLHSVVDVAETGKKTMPPLPRLRKGRGGTALSMLGTAEIEDAAEAAIRGTKWAAGKIADISKSAWAAAGSGAEDFRRLTTEVLTNPKATQAHVDALNRVMDGLRSAGTRNQQIVSNLRSRLQTAMARTPGAMLPWKRNKVFQMVRDNIEGRLPDEKLPTEYVILRDAVREILSDLQQRANGITGTVGRENYFPRYLDHEFIAKVHEALKEVKGGMETKTNVELGRDIDAGRVNSQGVLSAIEAATDDVEKLFKIVRNENGDLVVRFVGDERDIPGVFTMRPQLEDGAFAPGLLPELFDDVKHDASYAGTSGMVKPKDLPLGKLTPDQARADLRSMLRGANARVLANMWDPEMVGKLSPSAQQRSRTWQLDGSLTQRRMFPDLGPTAYLDPLSSLEQVIERQTSGLSRLEAFGAKKFDEDGNYIGYSHKQKLEQDLTMLADLIPPSKLGVVEEGGGRRRLASSADKEAYMSSYLRSMEDLLMGYMRPFSEKKAYHDVLRGFSALSTMIALTPKTTPVLMNEASGLSLAAGKYGPRRASRLAATRAEVMRLQSGGALARAGLRTLGLAGTPEWQAHMRDMASNDVLEVWRAMGMGENPGGDIHRTGAEKMANVAGKLLGAFGRSIDGMSLAYHLWAQDMLHEALMYAKRDQIKPNSMTSRLNRAKESVTGTGVYSIIRDAKRLMGEQNFARAMDLVDRNGAPKGEAAYRELVSLGMPFVMDVKSLTAGSSRVEHAPKLWRSRGAGVLGWMMKTVLSLSERQMSDTFNEPTVRRKLTSAGRKALMAGAVGGNLYFLAGAAPMATKIALAAANGALLPAAAGAIASSLGYQGSGDEERLAKYRSYVEGLKQGRARSYLTAIAAGLPMPMPGDWRDPIPEELRTATGFQKYKNMGKFSEIPIGPLSWMDLVETITGMIAGGEPAAAAALLPPVPEWFGERAAELGGSEPTTKQQAKANIAAREVMPGVGMKIEGLQMPEAPALLESATRTRVQKGIAKGRGAQYIGQE